MSIIKRIEGAWYAGGLRFDTFHNALVYAFALYRKQETVRG